jgi:hypothetical protein
MVICESLEDTDLSCNSHYNLTGVFKGRGLERQLQG